MQHLLTISAAVVMLVAVSTQCAGSERLEDGRKSYEAACAECHETGLKGAPRTGHAEDWNNRSGLWEAVLFEHANNGYLTMPAKGGEKNQTEYAVDAAAEYMVRMENDYYCDALENHQDDYDIGWYLL